MAVKEKERKKENYRLIIDKGDRRSGQGTIVSNSLQIHSILRPHLGYLLDRRGWNGEKLCASVRVNVSTLFDTGTSTAGWKLLQANMSPSLPPSRFLACTALAAQRNRVYGLEAATAHFITNTRLHGHHTSRGRPLSSEGKERTTSVAGAPIHNRTIAIRALRPRVSFHSASFEPRLGCAPIFDRKKSGKSHAEVEVGKDTGKKETDRRCRQ